jgi:hypothetical protein
MLCDEAPLLPSADVIHDRLTRNERERRLLHALLRLSLRHPDQQPRHDARQPRQQAPGREDAR